MGSDPHPLRPILEAAARGSFPEAAGSLTVLPQDGDLAAVVGLTAAHFVLADVDEADIAADINQTDVGAAMLPRFLTRLADRLGLECGHVDLLMARRGIGGGSETLHLVTSHDSPRVDRAMRYRRDLAIHMTPDRFGAVILGTGLVGRLEMAIELDAQHRFAGIGRRLILDALRAVEPHEEVFAQVAPGNAASVRSFLAAGFKPIGSEVLLRARS